MRKMGFSDVGLSVPDWLVGFEGVNFGVKVILVFSFLSVFLLLNPLFWFCVWVVLSWIVGGVIFLG